MFILSLYLCPLVCRTEQAPVFIQYACLAHVMKIPPTGVLTNAILGCVQRQDGNKACPNPVSA